VQQTAAKYISQEEYLAFERNALDKHEYYRGEIFAMSGASFKHNLIESNLRLSLGVFLKDKSCNELAVICEYIFLPIHYTLILILLFFAMNLNLLMKNLIPLLTHQSLSKFFHLQQQIMTAGQSSICTGKLHRYRNICLLIQPTFILFSTLKILTAHGLYLRQKM
jgi:hypothetical protein